MTGVAGTSDYTIGRNIKAPRYFWKMVCYREHRSRQTHVVLWVGDNTPRDVETDDMKRLTLTPRSQQDLNALDASLLTTYNPWLAGGLQMRENFVMMVRYPMMHECQRAMTLPQDEIVKWKSHFSVFDNEMKDRRRKKRAIRKEGAYCSRSQLADMLAFSHNFANADEDDDDYHDDDGDDEEESTNRDDKSSNDEENEIKKSGDGENEISAENDESGEQISTKEDDLIDDTPDIPASNCDKKIVGYYPSWSKVPVSIALLSKFTHIIFAFFEMKSDGTVGIGNPDHSSAQTLSDTEVEATSRSNLKRLLDAKANLPNLKVTFAVGGWENSQYFSSMAANIKLKQNFIASVLRTIDEFEFDGVDIDWEYPVKGGAQVGIPEVSSCLIF